MRYRLCQISDLRKAALMQKSADLPICCCCCFSSNLAENIFPMLSPRSRNWTAGNYVAPAVPLQCSTFASHPLSLAGSLSLGTQIFPSILLRPFADIGDAETEQTVWGNQSSERVEDKVLSLSVCVCVCVSLCNLSRFFRHAVRAKTTNQTTLRLRLGPGRRRR